MRSSRPSVQYARPRPESLRGATVPRCAFILAMDPQQLAGGRIQRDHRPPGSGGGIENALDHQRRAFQIVFRARPRLSVLKRQATCSLSNLRR